MVRVPFTFPSSSRSVLSVDANLDDGFELEALLVLCSTCQDLVAVIEMSFVPLLDENWPVLDPVRRLTSEDILDQPLHCLMGWKHFGIVGMHAQMMTQDGSTMVNIIPGVWSSVG